MKIIVGLGNPGEKFENTRHNCGFMAVDRLAAEMKCPKFGLETKLRSEVIGCRMATVGSGVEPVLLVKPQTFMNSSGEAVRLVLDYYKDRVTLEDLWVVHDDVDLEMGRIKVQGGGGTAGHHGLESIVEMVGHGFARFRLGVGRPAKGVYDVEGFVLKTLTAAESLALREMVVQAAAAIQSSLKDGLEATMNRVN